LRIKSFELMADDFSSLPETKVRAGRRAEGGVALRPELIGALDWLRLADLMRGLVVEVGCELGGSQVGMDGAVVFGMVERPQTGRSQRVVVKLVGWNQWGAGPEEVEAFASEVRGARDARGVLLAPAGFSPAALAVAKQLRVEVVDATLMWAALHRLKEERREFLWQVATSGDPWTPSCPVCFKKLVKQEVRVEDQLMLEEERRFDGNAIVADLVNCKRLIVEPDCEVQFLQPVRATSALVAGEVHGDLLCDGLLVLRPCGVLHGRVVARSMRIEDGAQMLAETTILRGDCPPEMRTQVTWQWRCLGGRDSEGCAQVDFEPHETGGD
jgi:cytoskeletal protein CcmA (bactofilin family)